MQQPTKKIPIETVAAAGGDWGQYGELTGPQIIALMQADKIRMLFADTGLLVWLQRPDGQSGTYKFLHVADQPPPPATLPAPPPAFSNEKVAQAANAPLVNVQNNWLILYKTMVQYGISSPLNCVGMIGTIAKETGSFTPVREAFYIYDSDPVKAEPMYQANKAPAYAWYNDTTSHAAYSGGPEYHGRGYIQTTHIENYQKVKDKTGVDVVSNPDLLLKPDMAAHAACIYWIDRGISAMCERKDWEAVRRAVYGGYDADGIARIQRAEQVLLG